MKPNEIFRPVAGFEKDYRISDHGTILSIHRKSSWVQLRPSFKTGRGKVSLDRRRTVPPKQLFVHHLVLQSFGFPRPSPSHVTRHLNGNPFDNRLTNLRWGTVAENSKDMIRHGRSLRGVKSKKAKLTELMVSEIIASLDSGVSQYKIAAQYAVTQSTIWKINVGENWGHLTGRTKAKTGASFGSRRSKRAIGGKA